MRFLTTCLLLGLGGLVSARCGTSEPDDNIRALHRAHLDHEANRAGFGIPTAFNESIKMYIHVIQEDENKEVSDSQISEQIDVLNNRYTSTGFSFKLAAVNRVVNPSWRRVEPDSETEYEMKSELRQGGYADLNLYIDTMTTPTGLGELLGYATFPMAAPTEREYLLDGVVVGPSTLPEGKAPFDLGITAVHEVGHWLSLFHTFQPDLVTEAVCFGEGDMVLDTPAEASAASGCPIGRDTCPLPGVDPIHNYMDYSDDSCLTEFSNGQIRRIQSMWTDLRAGR